ncbi:hypothetical protein LQ953_06540 [Sphingomonas sp. IC-56]|uniref:hypothetical protein n=1 Tax=Sphingomonas sp. IC-56 TaxID=2898529 RepID=UPI001E61A927|nr:hypothetical protein [Sphingomonas sp. IC-56]MCD2323673.1 hypothetical protein [Sphingomonas sp. IC-56]
MKGLIFTALGAVALSLGTPARAQDNIEDRIINVPAPAAFTVYGLGSTPKARKDDSVQGGQALRIVVPGGSDKPYSIGVISPITKPVKKGDNLVLAFWGRKVKGDAPTAKVANLQVSLAKEPYSTVFRGEAEVGPEWKMFDVKGTADRDYAAGEIVATLHLATGNHTIDIGPVFLLDMGPSAAR